MSIYAARPLAEPRQGPTLPSVSPRAVLDTVYDRRTITVTLDQSERWMVDTPDGRLFPNTLLIEFTRLVATRNESLNPHDWRLTSVTFIGARWNRSARSYNPDTQAEGVRPGTWTEETHRVTTQLRNMSRLPRYVLDFAHAYRPQGPDAVAEEQSA